MTDTTRRQALSCMGVATLFTLSGGIPRASLIGEARADEIPLFAQISDTHIGFAQAANPDVAATLTHGIGILNGLPRPPALVLHTGDITHLSKPAEFDTAASLLAQLKGEIHYVPGEHDMLGGGSEFFARFGKPSAGRGWYSFDQAGVHFVALNNVAGFKAETLGALGPDQLAWLADDLKARSASQPIVIFAHMPLWTVNAPWGWGTAESDDVAALLRRFGSVTVLCGHIHQIAQKVEGTITFHTARSTAFPQPAPGAAASPGPMAVPAAQLPGMLGVTTLVARNKGFDVKDETLA